MRVMTRIAFALLVVASASNGCSLGRRVAEPTPAASIREILPNGVHVLVEEHRTSDVVALQLWVKAGGRDESTRDLGLAHYLEHMLFKGTPTRRIGFVDREIEGVGGRINAGTTLDYTYYYVLLPAGRVVPAIEMLADISVNAVLDEQQLEREKRVVLEEMRRSDDSPGRFLARRLYEVAFAGHPYGRPVIGNAELIRGLTRDQLLGFYRRHYVPQAFTLVVVGAVDARDVMAAARRTFGHLPRSGSERLPVPVTTEARTTRMELARPGSLAYLGMAWLAPRLDHADTPAVELLTAVLGRGRSSRLTQSLRERLGVVNSVSAGYSALEGAGLITVTAQLDAANLARAEQEIVAEVRRLQSDGVRADERARAVTAIEARREFHVETAEGRAALLGHAETIWTIEGERAYIDRVRAVTALQLQAVARRYFDPEHYSRVALLPR